MRPDRFQGKTSQVFSRNTLCALLALFLTACAAVPVTPVPPTQTPLPAATPTLESAGGWRPEGEPRRYGRETLYDLVDGAADLYFSYGTQDVTVQTYVDDAGRTARVEIYTADTPADAYGLYTYHSYGEPVTLGNDGEFEPGYRLAFWQNRAFVQIVAREAVDDDALLALGQALAGSLPQGGARPSLVGALPKEGLQPGSTRFFREKLALDNLLWLGSDDLLGLGPDVQGVVAHYEIAGTAADLLLVSYPSAERAERALAALEAGQVEGLVAAQVRDQVLGAVFGSLPAGPAASLLADALDGAPQRARLAPLQSPEPTEPAAQSRARSGTGLLDVKRPSKLGTPYPPWFHRSKSC